MHFSSYIVRVNATDSWLSLQFSFLSKYDSTASVWVSWVSDVNIYIYIYIYSSPGAAQPIVGVYFTSLYRALASSRTRLLDHIQRRATVCTTPLNELSVHRRDLYLTTHNTHNRQTSMPRVGFEPTIAAGWYIPPGTPCIYNQRDFVGIHYLRRKRKRNHWI